MMLIRQSCREVAALLIAREDRVLPWADRVRLRLHLAICAACPGFERQVLTMRNAMTQWRNYEAPDASVADPKTPANPGG